MIGTNVRIVGLIRGVIFSMNERQILSHIRKYFPTTPTHLIAKKVNLSPYQVREIAKNHEIKKCPLYINQQQQQLKKYRKKWYESTIKSFNPTTEQEQIIFGSLLGDGYISRGAQRSINYYYQEHFGNQQRAYREWKQSMLKGLSFKISGNYLRSISHPYFTKLHKTLYKNNIKILTDEFL